MTVRLAPVALATILGLLGCAPGSVSSAEFKRRGNAVCAVTAGRLDQLAAPRAISTSAPEAAAGYVDAYLAELRQELADLRRIGYPAGERRRLSRAYRALDAALAAVERDPLSFRPSSLAPAGAELRAAGLAACRP